MSTFTNFNGEEHLLYDRLLSKQVGKDLWRTRPGFRYYIGKEGSSRWVDVETDFVTDGATIPRIFWSILPPIGEYTQCTTLHDKLCTTYYVTELIAGVEVQVPVTRAEIDAILAEAMDVADVTPWKKRLIKAGVNLNRYILRPRKARPVYELIA